MCEKSINSLGTYASKEEKSQNFIFFAHQTIYPEERKKEDNARIEKLNTKQAKKKKFKN